MTSGYDSQAPSYGYYSNASSNGYSIADELNSQFVPYPPDLEEEKKSSWAQRKGLLVFCSLGTVLYCLHFGLSCTTVGLSQTFFGFSWTVSGSEADPILVSIGAGYRVACQGPRGNATCVLAPIADDNFGGASSITNLSYWLIAHIATLILNILATLFILFAPHPRTDIRLCRYRWGCWFGAVLVTVPNGIAYIILGFLANAQENPQPGWPSIVVENIAALLSASGLIWASRLARDPDWVLRADVRKGRIDRQRRREQQERKKGRAWAKVLGDSGMRQLALTKLMNESAKPQQATPAFQPAAFVSQPPAQTYIVPQPTYVQPQYYSAY